MKKTRKSFLCLLLFAVCLIGMSNNVSALTKKEVQQKMISVLYGNEGGNISCDFDGYTTTSGRHEGIDFCRANGAVIHSLTSGTVIRANNPTSGLSTLAIYDSINNKTVLYLHATGYKVSVNQKVTQGQAIALEGTKGTSSAHTHVEVRNGKQEYASKSVNDPVLDNENPYPYWEKIFSIPDEGNNSQGMIDSYSGGVQKISIAGWAFDADQPNTALEIHVYIGTKCVGTCIANKERPDVNNVYGVGNNHGFDATFSVSESGENLVKIYAINVGRGENTLLQSIKINILKDTEKPTISNVQITDHSKNGYTITCDVSDNVGINKVLFPTWNDSEGTASAKWLEGTVSGGKATIRVNVSDWDNKEGIYYTDIYASDKSGNEACYSRITRYIDRTPPTISEVKVTSMDVDGYTVSCKVTDNKTMSRVQSPHGPEKMIRMILIRHGKQIQKRTEPRMGITIHTGSTFQIITKKRVHT